MAVTQYIGSRYVPLFADPVEWSSENTYEPLTIVLHEGNSYTSKQAVPKGIDITNEEYWALTGNYNAQIELYRRDTAQALQTAQDAQGDIDTLLPKSAFSASETVQAYILEQDNAVKEYANQVVEDSKLGFDIGWFSDGTGTCIICKGETGVICLDIGSRDGSSTLLYGQIFDFLAGRKIDTIVISHYHDDHSTGYDVLKQFAKDGCVVYEQMNPTTSNTQYELYVTNRNNVINAFGAANVRVPVNNEVVEVGDLQLRMINTDPANIAAYNAVRGESVRNANGLNVFSIISFVSKNGNVFCHTGDAEGITQRLMVDYAEPCDLITTPHHGANYLGYSEFFDRCAPSAFLYTKRNTTVYNRIPIASYTDRFTGKYSIENNTPLINGGSKAIVALAYNKIVLKDAVVCSKADGTQGYAYSPMEMLGSTFYNDDPYSLVEMTGNDFLNNCRSYNPQHSCTFTGGYNIFGLTPQFVTDIINYLGATATEAIRITPFGSALFLGNPNIFNGSKMALMAGSANLSEDSTSIIKIDGISRPQRDIALSEGVTSHTITDNILRTVLANGCENFYVRVSAGADIATALRIYVKPTNVAHNEYRGIGVDRGLTRLFSVAIVNNVIQAHVHSLANQTTADGYIGGYGVGI